MRTAADLQSLFDCYNGLYWQDRLPRYEVVVSTKYSGGFCEKWSRKSAVVDRPAAAKAFVLLRSRSGHRFQESDPSRPNHLRRCSRPRAFACETTSRLL